MKSLSQLGSVIRHMFFAVLMVFLGFYVSEYVDTIVDPPKQAFYKKCNYSMFDEKQKKLCEWVDSTVDYYNQKCGNCMKREGNYPIVVSWGDQSGEGTLGHATQERFSCKIELAINEDWLYDDSMKFRTTVLHEIGHCYGIDHDNDINSVMYPSHNPGLTEDSIFRFVKKLEQISK